MNKEQIVKQIEALIASIAQHEQEEAKKNESKLKINGLDITIEELLARGDAQTTLIKLHNALVNKIDELEKRLKTAEENIEVLESDINKHLN